MNWRTDVAMCRVCDEVFSASRLVDRKLYRDFDETKAPAGTWFRKDGAGWEVGASTRGYEAWVVVPVACLIAALFVVGIWTGDAQLKNWIANPLRWDELAVFTCVFCAIAGWGAMLVAGKVRVRLHGEEGSVFIGVGPLGRHIPFRWSEVTTIKMEDVGSRILWDEETSFRIVFEGKTRIEFGRLLRGFRRDYVLHVLKKMLVNSDHY